MLDRLSRPGASEQAIIRPCRFNTLLMFKLHISEKLTIFVHFWLMCNLNIRKVLILQGQIMAYSKPHHLTKMTAVEKKYENQPVKKKIG